MIGFECTMNWNFVWFHFFLGIAQDLLSSFNQVDGVRVSIS